MRRNQLLLLLLLAVILLVSACSRGGAEETSGQQGREAPSVENLDPDDPETYYIQYGKELFDETASALPENTGNELACASCHADGDVSTTISMVGVTHKYPGWRGRENTIFTLEDRINGCFKRSMNGKELDYDGEEMNAMMAYLQYVSEDTTEEEADEWLGNEAMEEVPEPDVDRGEELFEEKSCVNCHASDGSGRGMTSGPALWGDGSFNDGAGLNRLSDNAGFIKNYMPKFAPGTLTDQEAADLAAYILSHERPVWPDHDGDWEDGGTPPDIIYEDRRKKIRNGTFDWTELDNVIPAEEYDGE